MTAPAMRRARFTVGPEGVSGCGQSEEDELEKASEDFKNLCDGLKGLEVSLSLATVARLRVMSAEAVRLNAGAFIINFG